MSRCLIVFARAPLPGTAKTRLACEIGELAAAGVYARLLHTTLSRLIDPALAGIELRLAVARASHIRFFAEAYPEFHVFAQPHGNLGHRLASAFDAAFEAGFKSVAVTATDVPALDAQLVALAFDTLDGAQGVIGPCPDGGYYLLGLRAPGASLFESIAWGTDRVLEETERLASAAGLDLRRLPQLPDVDTSDDLCSWHLDVTGARSGHAAGSRSTFV